MHLGIGLKDKFITIIVKIILLLRNDQHQIFKRSKIKKVLIYAYTGMGNFVLYTPTLKTLKNYLPNAKFTLLHGNDTGCHEVVSGLGLIDNYVIIARNANLTRRFQIINKLRKEKYDLVISEFHNNNSFFALASVLCGAKYRVGHVSSPGWRNNWDFIYNIPVKMKKDQHEIDRYLELVYALGINKNDIDKNTTFYLDEGDKQFALYFFRNNEIEFEKEMVISVQMGTSPTMRWKQWDLDKYSELCDKILDFPNTKIIFLGSPNEKGMIDEVSNKMNRDPIIAAGKTNVKQAVALIEKSDVIICNDSGLMHAAVAVDTPVIAIYGPTDYKRTAPLGEKHTIIRKGLECSPCFKMEGTEKVVNCQYDYKCLKLITVDEVFKVVRDYLIFDKYASKIDN